MPAGLAARPVDPHTGLTVPYVSAMTDPVTGEDVADFTALQAPRLYECGVKHWCGMCGTPLAYWIAFLGGPGSAEARSYVDPPMHEECALAAVRLCPHIAVRDNDRAALHRLPVDVFTPEAFVEKKPSLWVMGITRRYDVDVDMVNGIVFHPAPWKRVRTFSYDPAGLIVEMP